MCRAVLRISNASWSFTRKPNETEVINFERIGFEEHVYTSLDGDTPAKVSESQPGKWTWSITAGNALRWARPAADGNLIVELRPTLIDGQFLLFIGPGWVIGNEISRQYLNYQVY